MSKKKDKEKVIYYDDGSTISDMSGVQGAKKKDKYYRTNYQSTWKDKAKTFFNAMKMMIIPCVIALLVLSILFMVFSLLAK